MADTKQSPPRQTVKDFVRKSPSEAPGPAHPCDAPGLSPIDFLQAIYRDPLLPMSIRIPADVLSGFEDMLLPACKTEAFNPLTVPKGEIREVVKTDVNCLKVRHFIGQDSFVKFICRPGRRVVSFRTDQGYVDASGRGLR